MIKANEYRLGIIVMDVEPYDKIYMVDINMLVNAINGISYRSVPLTAEWLLEMFGAVPLEIGYRLSERLALCKNLHRDASGDYDGFNVMVKIGLDFRVLVGVPPIRHVHDLQNFYRWHTGEELNVKL